MKFVLLCTFMIPFVMGVRNYVYNKSDQVARVAITILFTFTLSMIASMIIGMFVYSNDELSVKTFELARRPLTGQFYEDYGSEYRVNLITGPGTSVSYEFCSSNTTFQESDSDKAYLDIKYDDAEDFGWFLENDDAGHPEDDRACEGKYVLILPKG